jgi:hypothetical protein
MATAKSPLPAVRRFAIALARCLPTARRSRARTMNRREIGIAVSDYSSIARRSWGKFPNCFRIATGSNSEVPILKFLRLLSTATTSQCEQQTVNANSEHEREQIAQVKVRLRDAI